MDSTLWVTIMAPDAKHFKRIRASRSAVQDNTAQKTVGSLS
jgi:hypothetical protein